MQTWKNLFGCRCFDQYVTEDFPMLIGVRRAAPEEKTRFSTPDYHFELLMKGDRLAENHEPCREGTDKPVPLVRPSTDLFPTLSAQRQDRLTRLRHNRLVRTVNRIDSYRRAAETIKPTATLELATEESVLRQLKIFKENFQQNEKNLVSEEEDQQTIDEISFSI